MRASLAMTARFGIGCRMTERDAISPSPSADVAAANQWDAEGKHERAVEVLAAASRKGDVEAMTRLGKRLLTANRAPYLPDQGTELIVKGANLGGADLVTVAHTVSGVQSKLLVRPDIRKPDDLRGKRIAVSGFGSLGDFLERYIIKKHGMDPVKDVIMLAIGTNPTEFKPYLTAPSMRPISPIRPTSRPSRKAIASWGMRNRKLVTRPCRSLRVANIRSKTATARCAWSRPTWKEFMF